MKLTVKRVSSIRGLMFRRRPKIPVMFELGKSRIIHMVFVFYQIDIAILDENCQVIATRRNLKPFMVYGIKNRLAKPFYCIEWPAGKMTVNEGDKVELEIIN